MVDRFNNSQTYTTPPFEDKTKASVLREGDKTWEKVKEHRKALNKALEILGDWNNLFEEMENTKAEKISHLPKERVEFWKAKLDLPPRTTFANL